MKGLAQELLIYSSCAITNMPLALIVLILTLIVKPCLTDIV